MSNIPISSLPAAIALDGSEFIPLVQGGVTKRSTPASMVSYLIGGGAGWTFTSPRIITSILDSAGNPLIVLTATVAAVNAITYANGATGNNATITASGETNTGITITGKGTKGVLIGNAALETVVTLADGATVALDASLGNIFLLTTAGNRTILAPTNAVSGQKIVIVHKAASADRTLALTTGSAGAFRFGTDITALTATTSGKTDYIGAVYNSADSRWDVVSVVKGF